MLRILRFILTVLFFGLLFSSCAMHPPTSEEVVFGTAPFPQTGPPKLSSANMAIARNLYSRELAGRYSTPTGGGYRELESAWMGHYSILGMTFRRGPHTGIGLSLGALGVGAGLDFTTRLGSSFFLTTAVNASLNMEIILQRKIWGSNGEGITLGGFYRRDHLAVYGSGEALFSLGEPFGINVLGLRSGVQMQGTTFRLRGFMGFGLESVRNTPVLLTGITIGWARKLRQKPPRDPNKNKPRRI